MLLTLRYTGLRANELVTLRTSEVDLHARRISLVGKGRKARVVPIPHDLAAVLRDYLDNVRPQLPASSYLFANPRGKPEVARSLRTPGALRSRDGGRDLGGRYRSPLPPQVASHLRHEPHPPRRGPSRRSASTRPLEHRDDHEVPAPVGRGPS